jgi:hypothetical protein
MLSETEVLKRVAAAGFEIRRTRFENWRERGLLGHLEQRQGRSGRGMGREVRLYPDRTVEQALEIARLRGQNLDLNEIGWRLWLAGYDVARRCWFDVFDEVAAESDAAASELREALDSDDLDKSPIEDLAKEAFAAETPDPLFKQLRKALGPDRLPAILLHFANIGIGEFTSISAQMDPPGRESTRASIQQDPASRERQADLRTMDVALGLGHTRTDTVDGAGPIIAGDYSSILRETFAPLANTTLTEFLRSVDSERLRKTTRDMSEFAQSIAALSQELNRTLAKDAFGFRRAALLARSNRKRQAQMGLTWTLILEKSAEKFHDLGAMAQQFDAAAKSAGQFPHSDELAKNSRRPNFRRGPPKNPIK